MSLSTGRYQSFVVRIWTRRPGGGLVHGRVTHVGTRESRTFRSTEEMVTFMVDHLKAQPEQPGPPSNPTTRRARN